MKKIIKLVKRPIGNMAPLRRDDAVGFLAWHNPWVDGSLLLRGVIS